MSVYIVPVPLCMMYKCLCVCILVDVYLSWWVHACVLVWLFICVCMRMIFESASAYIFVCMYGTCIYCIDI